jgi:hypothetical protein
MAMNHPYPLTPNRSKQSILIPEKGYGSQTREVSLTLCVVLVS